MKFRDGYWGLKKGVYLQNPVELRDTAVGDTKLTLYSATKKLHHRGNTLNCPILTTEISSPFEDMIRIRTIHHKGYRDPGPSFDISSGESEKVIIADQQRGASLTSGDMKVSIEKRDPVMEAVAYSAWELKFHYRDRYLTKSSGRHGGHVTLDVPYYHNYAPESGETYMCEYLTLSVGETLYGMGERFTAFAKNGQSVEIWNEDGGTASEQTYKNIPFYLSNRGYGVFVNNPGNVQFELGSEVVSSAQFSVPGEVIDYYVISGGSPKKVLENYTKLTGRPALPPAWSFGLWLTTSFTTNYDEETVTGFIDGMAERDIPLHVFHFDCFWMKEFQWVDFQWDTEQFPDPEGMLARLKSRGLHICVWINPYIAQKSSMFDEGMENGYLVMTEEGHVWQWTSGKPVWDLSTSPTRKPSGGTRKNCAASSDREWIRSKPISANGSPLTWSITTAPIRRRCIITIPIFITRRSSNWWKPNSAGKSPGIRTLGHCRRTEISCSLGRGLFRHLRVHGRNTARRPFARPVGIRVLESRHQRF